MKHTYDKKAAIKLINNYADQYHRIANDNKKLTQELSDLRLNNKIQKDIIESFYKTSIPMKDKEDAYLTKTREEIALLTKVNDRLTKEIQSLRNKTNYYEQIINKSITDYRESTETLQEKIFILENALIKKDNLILLINTKFNKLLQEKDQDEVDANSNDDEISNSNHNNNIINNNNNITNSHHKNEIYIIDPNMSVNLIQDDLMLYKQAYENALHKLKDNNCLADKYENRIDELRNEIVKLQLRSSDRNEWENGIIDLSSDKTKSSIQKNKKDDSGKKGLSTISTLQTINKEDIELLMQNEIGMKVMTIVNKCIEDKNAEIERLKSELKEQREKYKKVTEENMSLLKTIMEYKSTNSGNRMHMTMTMNNNHNSNGNGIGNNSSLKSGNKDKDSYADSYLNTNISMLGNTSGEEKRRNRNRHYNYITDKLNKIQQHRASLSQSMEDPQISFNDI